MSSENDQNSIISESSIGTYKSNDANTNYRETQINDSVLQSLIQRVGKMEKDNEFFRNLAFDLQREKNELKAKNEELEKRVLDLEGFRENIVLSNQERDIQIDEMRKTSEKFSTVIDNSKKAVAKVNDKMSEVKLLEKNMRSFTELRRFRTPVDTRTKNEDSRRFYPKSSTKA